MSDRATRDDGQHALRVIHGCAQGGGHEWLGQGPVRESKWSFHAWIAWDYVHACMPISQPSMDNTDLEYPGKQEGMDVYDGDAGCGGPQVPQVP